MQYLYEKLRVKKLNPIKLPLELAYSIDYHWIDITYKEVKINKN